MKKFLWSVAWNAHIAGKRAADFEVAAHRHGVFWFYVAAAAITWWFATWRWALIPEAIVLWTAWNATSANFVAHYIKQLETSKNDPPKSSQQQAPIPSSIEREPSSWERIAREHPGILYAHEQASYILQRQHPDLTLQQLREAYPHILFRMVPQHTSDWALWERLANDSSVPEATRQEYRVQLEIRAMLARTRAIKAAGSD